MLSPGGKPDDAREFSDFFRRGPRFISPIAELSASIVSPTMNRAIAAACTCKSFPRSNVDRVCEPGHSGRPGAVLPRTVAKLSHSVGAPALHRTVGQEDAGVCRDRADCCCHTREYERRWRAPTAAVCPVSEQTALARAPALNAADRRRRADMMWAEREMGYVLQSRYWDR